MMDLEKMETLLCVLERGSLSAAAEAMGYTPSGISRMMASLEEELGFPLLIRTHEGICPTKECEQMLPAIQNFVRSGDDCLLMAGKIKGMEIGNVVIGTAYSAFYRKLADLIKSFHEKYPGIKVEIVCGYSTELLENLKSHRLDLCIISKREEVSGWIPICKDPMAAWVPGGHPLAEKGGVPLEAFASEPYIDTYPDADIDNAHIFAASGIVPNTCFYTKDSYATWQMVDAGLGISMNNSINSREWYGNVKVLPLIPEQIIEIGVAHEKEMSLAGKMFLEFMKAGAEKLPKTI
ncbi:MAG: LysR family transcriptional regulator [Bacillus sp. (in: Bacteria)]|nr:LysR family transcriptional regulator [Bacillus sp. (in: firmicutes)]MCM1427660.1 LysR family transcriptional regulator [Eubacterium sp.]